MVPVKLLAVLSLALHGAYGGITDNRYSLTDLGGLADQGGLAPLIRGKHFRLSPYKIIF